MLLIRSLRWPPILSLIINLLMVFDLWPLLRLPLVGGVLVCSDTVNPSRWVTKPTYEHKWKHASSFPLSCWKAGGQWLTSGRVHLHRDDSERITLTLHVSLCFLFLSAGFSFSSFVLKILLQMWTGNNHKDKSPSAFYRLNWIY